MAECSRYSGGWWVAIGIAIGAAIGAMSGNIAIGVGIGVALGVAMTGVVRHRQDEESDGHRPHT